MSWLTSASQHPERDAAIAAEYRAGVPVKRLVGIYGVSRARVYELIRRDNYQRAAYLAMEVDMDRENRAKGPRPSTPPPPRPAPPATMPTTPPPKPATPVPTRG
jgi:hypothetical protein